MHSPSPGFSYTQLRNQALEASKATGISSESQAFSQKCGVLYTARKGTPGKETPSQVRIRTRKGVLKGLTVESGRMCDTPRRKGRLRAFQAQRRPAQTPESTANQ